MNPPKLALLMLCLICLACASSGGPRGPSSVFHTPDQVVVKWRDWLKDGSAVSWGLEAGVYRLELTASEGVTAEWIGATCPKTQPMRALTMTCEMSHAGQLVVANPTTFGLGPPASTTVELTKLGR